MPKLHPMRRCALLAGAAINILACLPQASAQTCTAINNVTDLQNMSQNLSGNYCLAQDIDASATAQWNAGAGFVPIGTFEMNFTGTFDGLGHTISNLVVNPATQYDDVGLFGAVAHGAAIANVGLIGGSVSGSYSEVGALVGWNGGTVLRSYATTTVNGGSYSESVGGLVGYNVGTVSRSFATGTVTGGASFSAGLSQVYSAAAGLVGFNLGTVTQSYATGAVSGSYYVGGLVAYNDHGGLVSQSYAAGTVDGTESYTAGGLVAVNYNYVSQSYATGAVSVGPLVIGGGSVGGLVGFNYNHVIQSYAIGAVTGASCDSCVAGGLLGTNWSDASVSSSYWNTITTRQARGAGADFGSFGATGMTTAKLKFGLPLAFDPSVWRSNPTVNDGFPSLLWQSAFAASIAAGQAPLAVTFEASGLPLPLSYTVDFDDGTHGALHSSCVDSPSVGGDGGPQCSGFADHTYSTSGTYTATLKNGSGDTLGTATITVPEATPLVGFTSTRR